MTRFLPALLLALVLPARADDPYAFDRAIPRPTLERYLDRAITMEGILHGRGDLADHARFLKNVRPKFVGRAICLWAREADLLKNLALARQSIATLRAIDPDTIFQACIFEVVTPDVEKVPVPASAFDALGRPPEARTFRYADMLNPDGKRVDQWGRRGGSVPDVSRPETQLYFQFLAAAYVDAGAEAIHFGQVELMNMRDPQFEQWEQVFTRARAYAATHARRHLLLCDAHVPRGGLLRGGKLLLDFHSFPLRVKETPDKPQEAILERGFTDSLIGRSKGGLTPSGWTCDHLPYLVELDNWGVSKTPGKPRAGGIWVWGYDEISWFAHQPVAYRNDWLGYARKWLRDTDANAHLEMPGSRILQAPTDDNRRWYFAHAPSPATPGGFDQEETIRAIWAADAPLPK